jgi:hypothetical protein
VLGIARRLSTWSRGFFPGILGSPNPYWWRIRFCSDETSHSQSGTTKAGVYQEPGTVSMYKHNWQLGAETCRSNRECGILPVSQTMSLLQLEMVVPERSPTTQRTFPVRQTVKSGLCPTSWQRPRRPRPLETAYAQHIRQLHVKGRPVSQFLFRNAVHLRV